MPKSSALRAFLGALALVTLITTASGEAWAAPEASAPSEAAASVDINSADVNALIDIPGIGKATAERIVAFREEHGPFRSVEDLMKVKGIGEKSLQKIRPFVKVGKSK